MLSGEGVVGVEKGLKMRRGGVGGGGGVGVGGGGGIKQEGGYV